MFFRRGVACSRYRLVEKREHPNEQSDVRYIKKFNALLGVVKSQVSINVHAAVKYANDIHDVTSRLVVDHM